MDFSIRQVGEIFLFFLKTLKAGLSRPFYFNHFLEQMNSIGIGSIPIALVIGLVTGLVMTLQFGTGLGRFGGTLYVPSIVSLSMMRELCPVFTSLLVGGRISSGMAAQISSMKVTEQVDALRSMGTSPLKILVVPRILATLVSLPLLTVFSLVFGYLGSFFIAKTEFEMSYEYFHDNILSILSMSDFFSALIKALVFGGIISVLSCYKGMNTRGGTRGVGESTQWAVVSSSLMILVADFFITKVLIYFWD